MVTWSRDLTASDMCPSFLSTREARQDRVADAPFRSLADHAAIERVPLDRHASRFANQSMKLRHGQTLGSLCTGVVINQLVDDGAVDVVGAETERHLSDLFPEHDP